MRRAIQSFIIVVLIVFCMAFGAEPILQAFSVLFSRPGADANETKAQLQCKALAHACYNYQDNPDNETHDLPNRLSDLHQPPWGGESLLKHGAEELIDPWGKPFKMTRLIQGDGSEAIMIYTTKPNGMPISQHGIGPASRVK